MPRTLFTHRRELIGLIAGVAAVFAAGCGGGDETAAGGASSAGGRTLTVYSSFPLQGAQREQSVAVVRGAKLALEQAQSKAGPFKIEYKPLDDSTAQAGAWAPEAAADNARKAALDESTAAYIGDSNSGATAVTLPILNEAGVPQISYSNTAVGLTTDLPGATPGEPDKYYPSGKRTYVRIVPNDTIQGAALATMMQEDRCQAVFMTNDKEVYGAGLASNIQRAAEQSGLRIVANDAIDKVAPNYRSLAAKARSEGADCFVYAGITSNNAVQLYKDMAAALPGARLYGADGVAESGFADPKIGGIPQAVAARTKMTIATLAPREYPAEGQEFFDQYAQKYDDRDPDPYAIYGFEAMKLALDAIERSESGERNDIVAALFDTRDRESVLGTYSVDENGDTTLTDYGAFSVKDGSLAFDQTIKAKPAQ